MSLEKLKNKEARLNAMAFSRFLTENGLDESLLAEFVALLADASKLEKLIADISGSGMKVSPEKRTILIAVDRKLSEARATIEKCARKLEELGLVPSKYIKMQDNLAQKSAEFKEKFLELQKKLPENSDLAEISIYLKGFLTDGK